MSVRLYKCLARYILELVATSQLELVRANWAGYLAGVVIALLLLLHTILLC